MNFWAGFFSVFQGFDSFAWGVAYAWLTLALAVLSVVGFVLKLWLWKLKREVKVLQGRVK